MNTDWIAREASWSAPAKQHDDGAFERLMTLGTSHPLRACESGVALRFPPQSTSGLPFFAERRLMTPLRETFT